MGKMFEQILKELRELGNGASVQVTLVTNQNNQVASYATGFLVYQRWLAGPEQLMSSQDQPLQYLFSDRTIDVDHLPLGGSRQPFSVHAADTLEMSFLTYSGLAEEEAIKTDPPTVRFTLLSHENTTFTVEFAPPGNVLYGVGLPIGPSTDSAVYVVSFAGPFPYNNPV